MRVSVITALAVAALPVSPALSRPLPGGASSPAAALVYRGFSGEESHQRHGYASKSEEYGIERGATTRGRHRSSVHDARELIIAELLARAIQESGDLYIRELEDRDDVEQVLLARAMASGEKKKIQSALDEMEDRELSFTWGPNWQKVHNANTSKLGGYKPGSRQDSTDPKHYHVGIFTGSKKDIQGKPIIEASFDHEPSSKEAIEGLEDALEKA